MLIGRQESEFGESFVTNPIKNGSDLEPRRANGKMARTMSCQCLATAFRVLQRTRASPEKFSVIGFKRFSDGHIKSPWKWPTPLNQLSSQSGFPIETLDLLRERRAPALQLPQPGADRLGGPDLLADVRLLLEEDVHVDVHRRRLQTPRKATGHLLEIVEIWQTHPEVPRRKEQADDLLARSDNGLVLNNRLLPSSALSLFARSNFLCKPWPRHVI
jgi:hypothetical protein